MLSFDVINDLKSNKDQFNCFDLYSADKIILVLLNGIVSISMTIVMTLTITCDENVCNKNDVLRSKSMLHRLFIKFGIVDFFGRLRDTIGQKKKYQNSF